MKTKIFGVLAVLFVFAFVVMDAISIGDSIREIATHDRQVSIETQICYDHGYSKRLWTDGRAYCYRLVSGTEQVVSIEQVK